MSKKNAVFSKEFPVKHLTIDEVEVFYTPSYDALARKISKEDLMAYINLVEEVQISPKTAFAKALAFKEKHPDMPELDNLLAYLYLQKKDVPNAEKLTEESYARHPHYFFARINFADQCLRKKQLEKVKEIFPQSDLKKLFPTRSGYHVSEFRGFMVLMSYYYLALGQRQEAENFYQKAYLADPAHISVMMLEKKLGRPSPFKRHLLKKAFQKLLKLARIFKIP